MIHLSSDEKKQQARKLSQIKAVLFDFDGTLTLPDSVDFAGFRKAIGCAPGQPILEYIQNLPNPIEREKALCLLDRYETEGAKQAEPRPEAESVICYLRTRQYKVGIITRNTRKSIERAFENFSTIRPANFDVIICRDDPFKPKPSPEGIFYACETTRVKPKEMLVVGDYILDMEAGQNAGAVTVFLDIGTVSDPSGIYWDFTISTLAEIVGLITGESTIDKPISSC